jgi:tetratricopeptide (TPR) repeat protein
MTDAPLEDLLAEFWARRDAGEAVTIEAFVAEHPAAADELRVALRDLLHTAALLPGAEPHAGDLPAAIGGHRIAARLGRGATGEVFAIEGGDRPLAVKRLLPHLADVDRAQQRLLREASVLTGVRHPNVVAVVEVGSDRGLPFVVMERIDGPSLAAVLAAARAGDSRAFDALPGPGSRWLRIARCGAALASGLAAAHAAGVWHRDLKPANVLLRSVGTPVLVDFGLAAAAAAATLTGTGDVLGTPQYMAPEQARGDAADERSDVSGLCAILYELATLQPPFAGHDPLQVLALARRGVVPAPRRIDPSVPRELDLLLRRGLAFRREHRHRSAAALATALQAIAAGGRPITLTLPLGLRLDAFWRQRRAAVLVAAALLASCPFTVVWLDRADAAHRQHRQQALATAATAQLDGDRAAIASAAAELDHLGERGLAGWLRTPDAPVADPFVQALAAGCRDARRAPQQATVALRHALALRPDVPLVGAWLGIAAAAAKEPDRAEAELLAASRALPQCVRVRVELARALAQRGHHVEAIAELQHAVTLPGATADTWHELAKRHARHDDPAAALPAVDEALRRAGGEPPLAMLRTKAVVLDGLRRLDEAEPLFRLLVERAPDASTWHSYARLLDRLHRLDEAAAGYGRALALEPQHVSALGCLVHLHAGSDRATCAGCRTWFEQHPSAYDPALVDRYATELLLATRATCEHAELMARYVRGVGGGPRFAAALADLLAEDLPAEPLGRLLRAQRVLRGE